jgi:hypothetical protein
MPPPRSFDGSGYPSSASLMRLLMRPLLS